MSRTISETDWLSELQRLSQRSDSGKTSEEWCEELGRSPQYVLQMLRRARKAGWLVVGKSTRTAINGRVFNADVYRIVRPKK